MKQLINKIDRRVRLVGLGEAWEMEGYIEFKIDTHKGCKERCFWPGEDWEVADYGRAQKVAESEDFRRRLKEKIKEKGFTASGLGLALGKSKGWLNMVLTGKRVLPEKYDGLLERELGLPSGCLAGWRKGGKNASLQ